MEKLEKEKDTKGVIATIWVTLNRDLATFEASLLAVRSVILRVGASVINSEFATKMDERYPELNGAVKGIQDFAHLYSEGINDKKIRGMADFALHGLWGTGNAFLSEAEKNTLEKLNVRYSGLLSDGSAEKRSHRGGSIKALLVKKKSSMMEIIKNHGRRSHKEVLYRRKLGIKTPVVKTEDNETALPSVVLLVRAEKETHGFVGYIGLCEGHAELKKKDSQANSDQQAVVPKANVPTDNEVMDYVRKMAIGGVTTLEELKKRVSEGTMNIIWGTVSNVLCCCIKYRLWLRNGSLLVVMGQ